jgi:hypothetical protein
MPRRTFAQLQPHQQRGVMALFSGWDDHDLDRAVLEHGDHWPRHLMGKCEGAIGGPCPLCKAGK